MEVGEATTSGSSNQADAALLVNRVLDRVMARPQLLQSITKGLRRCAEDEARVALRGIMVEIALATEESNLSAGEPTIGVQALLQRARLRRAAAAADTPAASPRDEDEPAIVTVEAPSKSKCCTDGPDGRLEIWKRSSPSEVCRRLLYQLVFAAGVNAQVMAHLLLLQSYRSVAAHHRKQRFVEDELMLILVNRLCSPVEWARCAVCCRQFYAKGLKHTGLLTYWMSSYSTEGRKEAMRFVIHYNVIGLLHPLVRAGADVNCVFEQYWFRTPLHRAASRGHAELCRQLLLLRANPALRDSHGAAPIHLVASKGRYFIVDLLLRHDPRGATAVDYGGRTACHMAALKGHLGVVQRLVAGGAGVSVPALDGRTPLDMATRGEHEQVVHFLESWQRRHTGEEEEVMQATRLVLGTLFYRTLAASQNRTPR
mmetsp:Transcript_59862/g.106767  ORF Transcript_59862/g.106767 Transcript_59862/m.106767 type:complete len:427 (-) Transcript_59862:41-1321(-)